MAAMYDCFLGEGAHLPADLEAASLARRAWPGITTAARVNRAFMRRATRHLAAAEGITQFLDIGSGIPSQPNLHQIAQDVTSQARVVYIDRDPVALMATSPARTGFGPVDYALADLRDPERILTCAARTLFFDQPVAVSFNAVLHFVPDDQNPQRLVRQLMSALAPGSFLTLTHATGDFSLTEITRAMEVFRSFGTPGRLRRRDEVEAFFDGLVLLPPGVEVPHRWHSDPTGEAQQPSDGDVCLWAGVARKP
ncbi:SAM-dependent methyltransferase [Streptomyces vinaceus]|uniref:SAM-dependent methyltransferase n=1 Tax=Streptomyces vinaceus TaxID=1960 RepID=UPI0036A90211